jgi:hypothetical protein
LIRTPPKKQTPKNAKKKCQNFFHAGQAGWGWGFTGFLKVNMRFNEMWEVTLPMFIVLVYHHHVKVNVDFISL